MILTPNELTELYEGVVKPSGHPDPLGYMTRAIMFSGGDPDYIDVDGKQGFMPVTVDDAFREVGAQEVQSLQSNVIATIAMDRNYFAEYGSLDTMVVAFHYGRDMVDNPPISSEAQDTLTLLADSREEVLNLMYPPIASVTDVIKLLTEANKPRKLSKEQESFFKFLAQGI